MQQHARVVVIGGGVVGCSVLYHLTKLGWSDVVLLERKELTAGSTWHAAGGFHTSNGNGNMARLQAYTCGIYHEIQELSGRDVGAHYVGGLLVAATPARWQSLRAEHTRHRVLGVQSELLGPEEIQRRVPIMDVSEILGGIFDPLAGYLDPSGATHAYAISARNAGATIHRHTMVKGLALRSNGEWEVKTDKGSIIAEHVVNAAGLWAREVGQMVGLQLPLVPMEHHYLITEDLPELKDVAEEMPEVADLDGGLYMRQEHKGMLLGVYERKATPWAVNGTSWDYEENELLVPDLDRIGDELSRGFARYPAIANAGIKRIVNGPFTFSPDGNPLVGPVAGLPNFWVACGTMAGFVQGGGVGRTLAEWIIQGQPTIDPFGLDVARFDPQLPTAVVIARAREFYGRRFDITYPNQTWPVGRPLKTSPLYGAFKARNVEFLSSFGFEGPAFFPPADGTFEELPSFGRSNAFALIAEECRVARNNVGVVDISAMSKYRVTGTDANIFLRKVIASPLPTIGRASSALMLSGAGKIIGDLTVAYLADGSFWLIGPTYMQAIYLRWFDQHQAALSVQIENISEQFGGLFLVGPSARAVFESLTTYSNIGSDLADGDVATAPVGYAPCQIVGTERTGDTGFDFYTPMVYVQGLYEQVMEAGASFGIRDVGIRAFASLAMEHAPGTTLREMSQDYTVAECGYGYMLDSNRTDYIGYQPAQAALANPTDRRLVALKVQTTSADPIGDEPVWANSNYVGHTTSGQYGHSVGYAMAMAFLDSAALVEGAVLEVTVLGERCRAQIVATPFPDKSGAI